MSTLPRIAVCCYALALASVSNAQWAFIPPASTIVASAIARQIAVCEAAFPAFSGSTERYLREVVNAAPTLISADAIVPTAVQYVENARTQSRENLTVEKCQTFVETGVPQALTQLPCIVSEEKKTAEFKAGFENLSQKYLDQGPSRPCTGILVQTPKSQNSCEKMSAPVMIDGVEPDSPADRAGVASGDTLLAISDAKVTFWREPEVAELRADIGSELVVSIKRGSHVFQRSVTVGRRVVKPGESLACRAR